MCIQSPLTILLRTDENCEFGVSIVQQVKLPLGIPATPKTVHILSPGSSAMPGKATGDDPSTWFPTAHAGDSDGVPGSRPGPGSCEQLGSETVGEDLCHSLSNKS